MIYLDNAATTLHKPDCVVQAVTQALCSLGNASRGTHSSSLKGARTVYETRCAVAKLFGFDHPDGVVFTANSTESLNIAINGLLSPGDHVITTDLEHNSVLRPLYRLVDAHQVELSIVPADKHGCVEYDNFAKLIQPNTKAIVCTHASNLTGNVLDLAKISAIAHAHGLLLIVDASQTAGAYPIHMKDMSIDVLCFTGHKGLLGPQGTGGLCVRPGVNIRPWKVGGSGVQSYSRTHPAEMPTRLEAGTLNGHGLAGLHAALEFLEETGVENIHEKEISLARQFYEGVKSIPGITLYGDFSNWDRTAIVTLNLEGYDSGTLSDTLSEDYGIATRPGAHCAPRMHQALGTVETGAVRFSFSWFNTPEEIDAAICAIRELAT